MKTLRLTIKKQWFDMIVSGKKTEEYREIKKYWAKRLCGSAQYNGENRGLLPNTPDTHWSGFHPINFKKYDSVLFVNGYSPTSPRAAFEFNGIEIKEGNPEWGAIKGEKYFTIKLGKQIFNPTINTVIKEEI